MKTLLPFALLFSLMACQAPTTSRPNILLFITDDQSFGHTSMSGCAELATPAFDRVAREGIWFRNGFATSPGCSPSRASLLTGLYPWELEAAGTHASSFPRYYQTYPERLQQQGYHVGHTGKGWGPGNWEVDGRTANPAGMAWNLHQQASPEGISDKDYATNFASFLEQRNGTQPFCFWVGTHEPHRRFQWELGQQKDLQNIEVPAFLPDNDTVRQDIADYYAEIEWADQQLATILTLLERTGELDNTILIVTSDNGMAFPRAKANLYEHGFHVPLAIRWGAKLQSGQVREELVSLVDLAPTILAACGMNDQALAGMSGQNLLPQLTGTQPPSVKSAVFAARERHSSSRYRSLGYPQRAIRTDQHLLIWNCKPERWPAGAPQKYGVGNYPSLEARNTQQLGPLHTGGYHDIDACPSFTFLLNHREDETSQALFQASIGHRPEWELYALADDPFCLNNLANEAAYTPVVDRLRKQLFQTLRETDDPRMTDQGDVFETYPRYSRLRYFPTPDWASTHPAWVPTQAWWK